MKTNKELIDKLKQGHIAIDNTGNPNVELLRAVLKEAFPKAFNDFTFQASVYYKSRDREDDWANLHNNLPTIPLNDFLEKEFVLPEKWGIKAKNQIEFNIITKWFEDNGDNKYNYSTEGYGEYGNYFYSFPSFKGYHRYNKSLIDGYTEITFEQFKEYVLKEKSMREQFPKDDFGIIVENNNGREIIDYLANRGFIRTGWDGSGTLYTYGVRKNSKDIIYTNSNTFSKTYTLQQLKNLENNMENKEITHYKILKDVWGLHGQRWIVGEELHVTNGESLPYFKETGLINNTNYFKPVYKSKEVVIRMGNSFDLTIKDGKVWHKSDNITQFVQNLVNCFDYVNKDQSYGQYKAQFKDVIFSSTGCERTETKLSEWILVYNELQKQK